MVTEDRVTGEGGIVREGFLRRWHLSRALNGEKNLLVPRKTTHSPLPLR